MNAVNTKVGIVAGAFDLLHAGHVLYLKEARDNCDHLVVALHIDPSIERPKNKPIQSLIEREIQLNGCRYVDEIIKYHTEFDLYNMLIIIDPDIRFLGDDYKGKIFTGKHFNIPIHYVSRDHGWSTTELRERIKNA